jgi:GrpB-like predicted nucleotidyltransferase (UPF0157 family)
MAEPICVVAYNPEWPAMFERMCHCLQLFLGDVAVAIEHVGSTAVPGLAAKPILDIDVVVRTRSEVAEGIRRLGEDGYVHRGDLGVRGREAFTNPPDRTRHHLYLVVQGSEALQNHLEFRDYLRSHPETAEEYGALKKVLAARFRDDREGYNLAKTQFVTDVLRRAAELRLNPSATAGQ